MCLLQDHVRSCPSRDHGDRQVWRASWKTWMQAKRRQVNLRRVHLCYQSSEGNLQRLCDDFRMWERLSDRRNNQTCSDRCFLRREAWNAGKGWRCGACHSEQRHVCGRDFGCCSVRLFPLRLVSFGVQPTELHTDFPDSWSISYSMGLIQQPWSQWSVSLETATGSSPRIWIKPWLVREAPSTGTSLHQSHGTESWDKAMWVLFLCPTCRNNSSHSALAQAHHRNPVISGITYSNVFLCFYQCNNIFAVFLWLFPGHIHQVKENLSKTPQELIPAVFENTWGIPTWNFNQSRM